jgi:hypothetical protein
MGHYHKFQKWITYIHTMAWHLIPILTDELKDKIDNNRRLECIDIYWNKCYLEKDKIDIIFSDNWIYHNFHNEEFFNSINNSKWE